MIPHILLIVFQIPDILQKWICTQDGVTDPTYKMNYVQAFKHILAGGIKQTLLDAFFWDTLYKFHIIVVSWF